jgi:RimJ/RimL family protein N-acetyltransferase
MYYGERVRLRRIDPVRDTDDRYRWMNDLEHTRYLGSRPALMSKDEVRKYLESAAASSNDVVEFSIETLDGRHIGGTCFRRFNHSARSCDFGIVIGEPEFQGRGYGTEVTRLMVKIAFEEFNMNRLWLHVDAENAAGIRAYEKAGFVREGTLRQNSFQGGQYRDSHVMAILRSEYEAGKGRA